MMKMNKIGLVVMLLAIGLGNLAYADVTTKGVDGMSVTGASATIAAGGSSVFSVPLNFENVNSSIGATVHVKGQENVTNLQVLINGTSCGNFTVGLWDAYPYDCDSAMTVDILESTASVNLTNLGSNPITLGAVLSVVYKENAVELNTTGLATSAEVTSVNDTVKSEHADTRSNLTEEIDLTENAILDNTTAYLTEINTTVLDIETNVTAIKADTTTIIANIASLPTDIWNFADRTLTELSQSIIRLA